MIRAVLKYSAAKMTSKGRIARCEICTKPAATQQTIMRCVGHDPSLGTKVVTNPNHLNKYNCPHVRGH